MMTWRTFAPSSIHRGPQAGGYLLPGTSFYVKDHPELLPPVKPATGIKERIERLHETVMQLPKKLFSDFWQVLHDVADRNTRQAA